MKGYIIQTLDGSIVPIIPAMHHNPRKAVDFIDKAFKILAIEEKNEDEDKFNFAARIEELSYQIAKEIKSRQQT